MLLATLLHFLARLMQITIYDVIAQDPNSPFAMAFANIQDLEVNGAMMYDFMRIQSPLMFLVIIFSGAGMICNDVKNNLMEIYFSKPITWVDYALGKILALTLVAMAHTAVPAIILVLMHNLMLPGIDTIKESWWWLYAILGFSAALILPCVLAVLASSALIKSKNFASVAVFMLLIANSTMGATLGGVLVNPNYYATSFPMTVNRIGQHLFRDHRLLFQLDWKWCVAYVFIVCVGALLIVLHRVRKAEIAQ